MNSEVAGIVHSINLNLETNSFRRDLSDCFKNAFEREQWETDTNLYFEPAREGTPHFIKNKILVQATWRHYMMIGTEMLKFQTEFANGRIDGGVYICVTEQL
jgi:hypothetical protein